MQQKHVKRNWPKTSENTILSLHAIYFDQKGQNGQNEIFTVTFTEKFH